jgi:hypothetical protein
MKITLKDKIIDNSLFVVPEFNFGQMQRWKGKERLKYSLELEVPVFINKISKEFISFRESEISENDTYDLEELIAYEKAGRPTLIELFDKNLPLLKNLIVYHEYDILHSIIEQSTVDKLFYSINSIGKVQFKENKILLEGICFEVNRS